MKLTQILKEIGESSSTPYSYQQKEKHGNIYDPNNDALVVYQFKTEKNKEGDSITYDVVVNGKRNEAGEYFLDVEYLADGSYEMTNLGKPFKIMATVVEIVNKVVEGDKDGVIDGIIYGPTEKEEEEVDIDYMAGSQPSQEPVNQRDMLYRAFISKALKKVGKKVEFSEEQGDIIARFKNN